MFSDRIARRLTQALFLLAAFAAAAPRLQAAGATAPAAAAAPVQEEGPHRILIAPAPPAAGAAEAVDQIRRALPALLSEAIGGDRGVPGCGVHDLDPDTLKALGADPNALPDASLLSAPGAAAVLKDSGSVRILVLPALEALPAAGKGAPQIRVVLEWRDLVAGKGDKATQSASGAASLVDAAGRAASAARRGWGATFKAGAPKSEAGAALPLSTLTSKVPAALASWAGALDSWNGGDVPGAEKSLGDAVAADPNFDLAKVDLAWITLGKGRVEEASSMAAGALKGKRLSAAARARASLIQASKDPAGLEDLGRRLSKEFPSFPWGSMAVGIALNVKGEHDPAVALLDPILEARPGDPFVLHEAGMASLGAADAPTAAPLLERASSLWPEHDVIAGDLAEAILRAHDPNGARLALERWGGRFKPGDRPIEGGEWSLLNPPPPVRAVFMDLVEGSLSKAVEKLERSLALLESAGAPVPVRSLLLRTLFDVQLELAAGDDEVHKQRYLNGARASFDALTALTSPEDREKRPWVLLRMETLLRLREGRIAEAKALSGKLPATSSLPGYDPALEAELAAAIAAKEADTNAFFDACRRAIQVRGSLDDLYRYAQGLSLAARWKEVNEQYLKIEDRIERWSAPRRADAILATAYNALDVPFSYSLGGEAGWWLGSPEMARERWGKFLAYFRKPDDLLHPFYAEAMGTGAKPAW